MEVLLKENLGEDHVSVGIQTQSASEIKLIERKYLFTHRPTIVVHKPVVTPVKPVVQSKFCVRSKPIKVSLYCLEILKVDNERESLK